jgi:hypothetical protein
MISRGRTVCASRRKMHGKTKNISQKVRKISAPFLFLRENAWENGDILKKRRKLLFFFAPFATFFAPATG